jgi:hypothetical protein
MKHTRLLLHPFLTSRLSIPFFVFVFVLLLFFQISLSKIDENNLYYKPSHLVWVRLKNGQLQHQDLLPLLSHHQVVIILEKSTDEQERNIQAFLQDFPAILPEIDTYRHLPLSREENSYAIGYLQDQSKRRHPKALPQVVAYLLSFKTVQPTGTILKALHDLTHMPQVDFALPVFHFTGKTVTPFIQFDVEFLAPDLILGGTAQIQAANSRSYVTPVDPERGFNKPVVLQLQKDAPLNILATVLRYQQMTGVVRHAQLRWLRVRQPVEIQSRWASSSGINSFSIWESIQYILSIERDRDVELLSKAFTEGAVYTWLSENTHLPSELLQVDRIEKDTQPLQSGRMLDEVSIWFRLSKTGTYIFSPYPVQAAFRGIDNQKRIETFQSEQPAFLTIPGHLPRQLRQVPGQLLALPEYRAESWLWRTGAVLGMLCLAIGVSCIVITARQLFRGSRSPVAEAAAVATSSVDTMKPILEEQLKDLEQRLKALSFHGAMEPERAWLRTLNVYIKRLLGVSWYQDENRLLGGLGTSSEVIKRSMLATAIDPEQTSIVTALHLVQAIEQQVMKQTIDLSQEEADALYARVASLTAESLTSPKSE